MDIVNINNQDFFVAMRPVPAEQREQFIEKMIKTTLQDSEQDLELFNLNPGLVMQLRNILRRLITWLL